MDLPRVVIDKAPEAGKDPFLVELDLMITWGQRGAHESVGSGYTSGGSTALHGV